MNLPEESTLLAREKAEELGEAPAEELYELGDEIDYGFREALKSGNYFRYPHEIDEHATCHEKAVYLYAVADEAGLEPRFIEKEHGTGIEHEFIDVKTDEGRKIVDPHQNIFGKVKYYSDHSLKVEDNDHTSRTTHSFDRIEVLPDERVTSEVKNLRRNPAAMILNGQILDRKGDDHDFTDRIKFDEEERALIRDLDFRSVDGFFQNNITLKKFFSVDGKLQDSKILFYAADDMNWNSKKGERLIAEKKDDGYETPEEISEGLKNGIKALAGYRRVKGDEKYAHSDEKIGSLIEEAREELEEIIEEPTGFRGKTLKTWLERMESNKESDSESGTEMYRKFADWLRYLEEREKDSEPEPMDVIPEHVEKHEEVLEQAFNSEAQEGFEAAQEQIECILEGNNISAKKHVEKIENAGISSAYKDLAGELRNILENGFNKESVRKLQKYGPLAVVEPEVRQRMNLTLEKAAEGAEDKEEELIEQFIEETEKTFQDKADPENPWKAEIKWRFNKERNEIKQIVEEFKGVSRYNTKIEVGYSLDGDKNRIKVEETMKGTEESFSIANLTVEQLKDIEAGDFRQEAKNNAEDILSKSNLMAPEPSTDKDFADKNDVAALFFGAERRDEFQPFSKKELEEFALKALKEDQWLLESPYFLEQRKGHVKKHVEEIWTNKDDKRLSRLAKNKIKSLSDRGKKEKLRELAEDEYGSKKELLADYSLKYDAMMEEHVDREEIQRKRDVLKKTIKKGLKLQQPDHEDIERFSQESGLEQLPRVKRKADENELKAEEVWKLSDELEHVNDREQKRGLLQALKAVRQQTEGEPRKVLDEVIRETENFTPNQNIRDALKEKGIELEN